MTKMSCESPVSPVFDLATSNGSDLSPSLNSKKMDSAIGYQITYRNQFPAVCGMLSRGLDSGAFSDICISCDGETFRCHRLVLAHASELFAALIDRAITFHQGQCPVIMMVGVKPSILKFLIEFIYYGTVNVEGKCIPEFMRVGRELKVRGIFSETPNADELFTTASCPSDSGHQENDTEEAMDDFLCTQIDENGGQNEEFHEGDANGDEECSSRTVTATSDISQDDDDDFEPSRGSISSPSFIVDFVEVNGNLRRKKKFPSLSLKGHKKRKITERSQKNKQKAPLAMLSAVVMNMQEVDGTIETPTQPLTDLFMSNLKTFQNSKENEQPCSTVAPDDSTLSKEDAKSKSSKKTVTKKTPKAKSKNVKKKETTYTVPAKDAIVIATTQEEMQPVIKPEIVRKTKEQKEIFEKAMNGAIAQVMESHNVVRAATFFGVPASTLRGRLKKLCYCPPPKVATTTTIGKPKSEDE